MQLTRKNHLTVAAALALGLGLSACAAPPTATSGAGNEPAGGSPAPVGTTAEVSPPVTVESTTGDASAMASELQAMRDRVQAMGQNPSPEDVQQMMGEMTGMLDRMQTVMGGAPGSPMAGADMQQMQDMMRMMQGMGAQMQGMMGGMGMMSGTVTPTMTDMMARMTEMHAKLDLQVAPADLHHPTATP